MNTKFHAAVVTNKQIWLMVLLSLATVSGIDRFFPRRWHGIREATPEQIEHWEELEAQRHELMQWVGVTANRWYVRLMFSMAYRIRPPFARRSL
jgi:hypothetical protein